MAYLEHIIHQGKTLLAALKQLNSLQEGPLVLFVVDDSKRMVGTLTDGDSRRALISGATVNDKIDRIMHRNFNCLLKSDANDVLKIRHQKELQMKLVPILNDERRIIDVIDLQKYKTRLPIDAVLMAGGKGERLRPLTEKTPKPLLLVGDKCIIDHNVDRLISYGLKHITVTVNYLREQLEAHYSEPRNSIKIDICREPNYLGTIGSIKFVKKFYNDTVLVMNSDLFTNIDYEDFYLHFIENNADMSVAAVPYDVSIPYGILDLDGRDVTGLSEKPKYNYYANAGIYLVKKSALAEIPNDVFFNATDLIEKLLSKNKKIVRYPLNGTWIDIGTLQEYKKANELAKHLS